MPVSAQYFSYLPAFSFSCLFLMIFFSDGENVSTGSATG
jgi:hypothetical protein